MQDSHHHLGIVFWQPGHVSAIQGIHITSYYYLIGFCVEFNSGKVYRGLTVQAVVCDLLQEEIR